MHTSTKIIEPDVLTVGHACHDLVYVLDHHPTDDEKYFAEDYIQCGGGPAANAAVAASRLGFDVGFCGYLGRDVFGELHQQEFVEDKVRTDWIVHGESPTAISSILVKPDGTRTVINSSGGRKFIQPDQIDLSNCRPKVILMDGHEPDLSANILKFAKEHNIPTILDAGSLHPGTGSLWDKVNYLVASRRFAEEASGEKDPDMALKKLSQSVQVVVITLGDKGLVWSRDGETGSLGAYSVQTMDGTGAGDAFHGVFAAGLTAKMEWHDLLQYASGAAALACTRLGARIAIPNKKELDTFLSKEKSL